MICTEQLKFTGVLGAVLGEGGKAREHKTSLHAIRSIMRNEGFIGMYTG